MAPIFRRGRLEDSYAVYTIFARTIDDFARRTFPQAPSPDGDIDAWWERRRPLFEHLARTAEEFWIAEEGGVALGYARSILRAGARELTEFFVLPASQSAGVGRELLARAFPVAGAAHRSIVATSDARAQSRYLRAGVYPRFPIYYFGAPPRPVAEPTDLTIEPFVAAAPLQAELEAVDQQILGYTRDLDHTWLAQTHQGFVYRRNSAVVGYGYTAANNGPFALLDARDYPAVLAHAETLAAERGIEEVGFEAPLINQHAVDWLLRRGYRMDSFFAFYMCDHPLGKLENYLVTSPPFFM
jgi:GNAT superfamily N-acetyltransferase